MLDKQSRKYMKVIRMMKDPSITQVAMRLKMDESDVSVALCRMQELGFLDYVGMGNAFETQFSASALGNYYFEVGSEWTLSGILTKIVIPLSIGIVGVLVTTWLTKTLWP